MTQTRHPDTSSDKGVTVRSGIVGMLHDVSVIADQAHSLSSALQSTVERLSREFEWPLGHFFVPGKAGLMDFAGGIRRLETPGGEALIFASRSARYGPGCGWAARVLEERAPTWIRDLRETQDFADPRLRLAVDHGLRGLLASPIVIGDEVLAVMEFFTAEPFRPSSELLDAMTLVSSLLGRVVVRARAEEELHRARDRADLGEDFFLTVNHKVRTPMNAVIGLADLLLRTPLSQEQKESVEMLRSSGADLMKTFDGMLTYLKLKVTGEGEERPLSLLGCMEEANPTAAARPADRHEVQTKAPTLRRGGRKVLVVEDDRINQTVALGMLAALDIKAEVVANGRLALEALERKAYDVLLMDVEMPEMDGFEATRRIRRQGPQDQQPYIIAMTAKALPGDREKCLAAGMNGYVSKPVTIEALKRALELR